MFVVGAFSLCSYVNNLRLKQCLEHFNKHFNGNDSTSKEGTNPGK